jgi:hypothetical protein
MIYKCLFAGDERVKGDEQRRSFRRDKDYSPRFVGKHEHEFKWHPVDLIGHVILDSDLIINEFRRPTK